MALITLRSVKGSALTNAEMDANFANLNTELGQKLVASSNLSDLTNAATARTNIGLGNVENKSSATIRSEITSANVTGALGFTPADAALIGAANGIATLGADGLVPSAQLPSFVDDVLEYANLAAFPATGSSGKIYVALDTNKTYRWSGSTYIEISASPGTTDSLTEGSVNLYFTTARARSSVSSAGGGLSYNSSTGQFSLDGDLNAIAALAGTTGLLRKTAADTWSLDTNSYLTGNQTITVSGDASGSGATAISLTLASVGTAGTYTKVTTDAKGRVTSGGSLASSDVTSALGYTPVQPNGTGASGTWGISITGNSGYAPTSGSTPLLSAVGSYSWSASTNGRSFNTGIQSSFVSSSQGYPDYGSVVRINAYSNDGGAAELYFPYSQSYGGSAMRYRLGQYDNAGWTGWKTVLDDSNYTSYAVRQDYNTSLNSDTRNTRGVTRLYRRDDNSDYSVQTYWTGSYWRLYGYNGDTGHADTQVGLADYASNSNLLDGYDSSNFIGYNGNSYYQVNNWLQLNGTYGLYCPTVNGAHLYPNNGTYGAWRVSGTRNSWSGIEFDTPGSQTSLMMGNDQYGFHRVSGGWRFYVESGSGYFPGNVTAYWSDERLKENLREIKHEALDILKSFTAYRFNWNGKVAEIGNAIPVGKEEIGLIAQQVQKRLPDAVVVNKAGAKAGDQGFDYLTINYDRITPLLVEAVNLYGEDIVALKAKVERLEAALSKLIGE